MQQKQENRSAASAAIFSLSLLAAAAVLGGIRAIMEFMTEVSQRPSVFSHLIVVHEILPRMVVAILAGAALGLAGCVMQRVLRNSLAEPTTLGSAAGAQLALVMATLFEPTLLAGRGEWIALAGAIAGTALCLSIAARSFMSPLSLILGGLIVNLLCSSTAAVLTLFHWNYLTDITLWSAGTLVQNDWSVVIYLLPRLAGSALLLSLLIRPLSILTLEDDHARNLGLSLPLARLMTLGVAVLLSAFVVSAVGLIGFVGLAAPFLARAFGAIGMRLQMAFSGLLGAGLLWLTDELVQSADALGIADIPTGTATAVLGAPLLIVLLGNAKSSLPERPRTDVRAHGNTRAGIVWGLLLGAIVVAIIVNLDISRDGNYWHFDSWQMFHDHLKWRWPRAVTAMSAGMALAASGAVLQRLTGNPMASPELLGTTSGASGGVIAVLLTVPDPARPLQLLAGTVGAFAAIGMLLLVSRKSRFSPERMLLTGVAITTVFGAVLSFLLAAGDPRLGRLLAWMSGSTYAATPMDACVGISASLLGIAIVPTLRRWLATLPLAGDVPSALGVDLRRARLLLLLMASALSATATLAIGPLSFVGLMAPHLIRMAGIRRPLQHIYLSAAAGGLIMIIADWLGRTLMFPDQVPAGLLATLLGTPYLLFRLARR